MWLKIADILLNLSVVIIFVNYLRNRNDIEFYKRPSLILKIGLALLLFSTLIFLIIIIITPFVDFIHGVQEGWNATSSQAK